MTRETVLEIMRGLFDAEIDMGISVSGVTIYQSDLIYAEIAHYYDYIFVDIIKPFAGHGAVYLDFKAAWDMYISLHGDDLKRAYDALRIEYEPLHNYDMQEQGIDGERVGKQTTTTTPHGKITTETSVAGTVATDTEIYKTGVESSAPGVLSDKQTTTETPTNRKTTTDTSYAAGTDSEQVTEHDNNMSAAADGHTISGAARASEHYLSRSGNIGVTTSQQMLQSELELRQSQELLESFVHKFVGKYCYYAGGVCSDDLSI